MKSLRLMAALGLSLTAAASAQTLTLRDAAVEALSRNPQTAAAAAEVSAARARQTQARSAWLPVVDATASLSESNNPVFVFGSLLEQGRFGPEHFNPAFLNDPPVLRNDRMTLNVRYPIFDQLRRYDATKQAAQGVTRATAAAGEAAQAVLAEVISRYYGVAVADQRRAVAADAVRAAAAAADATRDKAKQGLVVESDQLAAEVQLAQFRQQEIEAEGQAAIARAALASTLQRPLLGQIDVDPALPERDFPTVDLSSAVEDALKVRGDIASAQAARAAAELQLRTARGALLPRIDAYGSWGASGQTFTDTNSDHTVALMASIDVFNGSRYGRVAEARAGVEGTKAMEAMARDRVSMEAITAWHRANAARQQLEVATTAARQAESAARIVRDRYDNGLTTITEELRSQTALVAARLALLAARHQYITGYAELLRATGGLHDIDPFL